MGEKAKKKLTFGLVRLSTYRTECRARYLLVELGRHTYDEQMQMCVSCECDIHMDGSNLS